MNTNNTPNGAEGPPAPAASSNVRGHAAADTAATSPITVHAPSSTEANGNGNNSSAANSAIQDVKPAAVESTSASASDGKVEPDEGGSYVSGDISKTLATLPQPSRLEPPRPFNVAKFDEAEDAELKNKAKQAMATDASSDLSEMVASLPQPILPKPPRPFNVADYDEGEDSKLKNETEQAMAAASSLPQPQPNRLEPPRPFNVAKFDEAEDAELKNKAKHVGASKIKESIIIPTEEDIADGSALDPATSRERPTRGDEGEAVDLESGGEVEPIQSREEESEESSQDDVASFNSELPVLEAYIVEEESRRDLIIATQLEPTLPWWKQRRTKLLLGTVLVIFAAMAIALGVSMSSSLSGGERAPTPSQSPTSSQSPTFTQFESLKLVADDGAWGDRFGRKVAIFGNTLVVGASSDDDKGEDSGSVYIYYRDPDTKQWIFHQKLVADDGAAPFGESVAIYSGTVVVGADGGDDKGNGSGSAYIYHQDPEAKEWILLQKLVPDDGAECDEFGVSVVIYNDTIVVGAYADDDKGDNSGSAYIYHHDTETKEWILQQKLVSDDGAADDYFGYCVAIYNGTVIVGAYGDDDKGYRSGSAYIYHQDTKTKEWLLQNKLLPDRWAAGYSFGKSVSIFEDTLVVGAPGALYSNDYSGSAYIYHEDPLTRKWIFQQNLVPDDGAAYDYFGKSVAIHDSTLVVVGEFGEDDKGDWPGSAYIYHQDPEAKDWVFQQKLVADDGEFGDEFGWSVSIFEDTLVVGAPGGWNSGIDYSGSVYVYFSSLSTTPSPTSEHWESMNLVADDGAAGDEFGGSVAIYGSTLVVGAYQDDTDKGDCSGSAYIYHQDTETKEWIMRQKLVPDGGARGGRFGNSVAIYDNTIIVGAKNDDGDVLGSAYIYFRDPETKIWILQQKLAPDDGAAYDKFGDSVSIYGNTLIVGAYGDDDKGENSGSAYIYHQDSETKEWILQQKLVADDGADDDRFGGSVAIYDSTVVVGANGGDDKGNGSGSAYIYHQDPDSKEWIFQQKLVPDDGAQWDLFGTNVAIYNDTIVVGAWGDDDMDRNSGSAYIYHQDSETKEWILQQKLVADDGAADDEFGLSVAIYGNTIVVGAKWDDDNGNDSGSAYIYHQDSETKEWLLQNKLLPDDGAANDWFGKSVAIHDSTVVVVAYGDDTEKGTNSGSVYAFYSSSYTRVPSQTPSMVPSTTLNPSAMPTQSSMPSTSSPPPETCYNVTIVVVYDEYPLETSWEIVSIGSNDTGVVVKSYEELDRKATYHAEGVCLHEGDYEFIISDSFGDGFCCMEGEGNYNVTTWDGQMIAQGGEFGAEDRTRLSIPFTPVQPSPT